METGLRQDFDEKFEQVNSLPMSAIVQRHSNEQHHDKQGSFLEGCPARHKRSTQDQIGVNC